jgi:signal transduction histidine kinase
LSDRRRLERIVGNLIGNGVRHGGGSATVTTGTAQGEIFVAVADPGQGVRVEEVPHLFEPFHKVDRARGGGGSGLGLTIAAEHTRLLGGRIDVESTPGTGACFRVCLPAEPPAGHPRSSDPTDATGVQAVALTVGSTGRRTGPDSFSTSRTRTQR